MSVRRPWCLHSEVSPILIFRCKSLSWLPAQGGDEIASQKRAGKEKVEAVRQCNYNANTRAEKNFFNRVSSTMHNCNISSKKKFSILSKLMRKKNKISFIPPIIENGKVISEPDKKSEIFNKLFWLKMQCARYWQTYTRFTPKRGILTLPKLRLSNYVVKSKKEIFWHWG